MTKNNLEDKQEQRRVGKCDGCGTIHIVRQSKDGSLFVSGRAECPRCGGRKFTEVTASGLGLD